MMPPHRRDMAATWASAAEVCETAAAWLTEAGADTDPRARARLLTTHRHRFNADVLGGWLPADILAQEAADVAADLDALDNPPDDDAGGHPGPRQGRDKWALSCGDTRV